MASEQLAVPESALSSYCASPQLPGLPGLPGLTHSCPPSAAGLTERASPSPIGGRLKVSHRDPQSPEFEPEKELLPGTDVPALGSADWESWLNSPGERGLGQI